MNDDQPGTTDGAGAEALARSHAAHLRLAARPDVQLLGNETITLVLYPGFTALDLVGPQYFFASMMGATVHLASTAPAGTPVMSDTGLAITTTISLDDVPTTDVLFVPGSGDGLAEAAHDEALLGHLRRLAATAALVTSVCTGSAVLGAAGLLVGRAATSHWAMRAHLGAFGAVARDERIVTDGNVVTAAGVTAGIDLGVHVTGLLRGPGYAEAVARQAEIVTPLPDTDPELTADLRDMFSPIVVATLAGRSHSQP